jgi:hypothetical protein
LLLTPMAVDGIMRSDCFPVPFFTTAVQVRV